MSYTKSEEYQKEIADQYKKRTVSFPKEEVKRVAADLGFSLSLEEIVEAKVGNMNATYLTDNYVIKITKNKSGSYLANKIVSDAFPDQPVVHVLAHDLSQKTPYEVLVMKKSLGIILQEDLPALDQKIIESLFSQVLDLVLKCFSIQAETFSPVANPEERQASFKDLQIMRVKEDVQKIRDAKLANEADISKIESYFNLHADVLNDKKPVLVHTDLHMGNIMHQGDSLTAIIDWDTAMYGPAYTSLPTLLGLINNPAQFVEGAPDYQKYKDLNFKYLLPILKDKLSELFLDESLLLKLNLYGIAEGLMWVSQNWSKKWNEEMIKNLVGKETPTNSESLKSSYYGKILT